jgi:hypothetical protein
VSLLPSLLFLLSHHSGGKCLLGSSVWWPHHITLVALSLSEQARNQLSSVLGACELKACCAPANTLYDSGSETEVRISH